MSRKSYGKEGRSYYRPRLADDAMLRFHRVDQRELFVLHDTRDGSALELEVRLGRILLLADGTRDFDGIVLAAAREGWLRRASEIEALLSDLSDRGLMADGIPASIPFQPPPASRPLEVLPSYRLDCKGLGNCCRQYGSYLFTRAEVEKARCLPQLPMTETPDEADHPVRELDFMPAYGVNAAVLAVPLTDGACRYLGSDHLCRIHAVLGEASKPRGCRNYPRTFVDDGEAVRVSVVVECACVLQSLSSEGGEPLVREGAKTAGDLPPQTLVSRLASEVRVAEGHLEPVERLRAWTQMAVDFVDQTACPVAAVATLATELELFGLRSQAPAICVSHREVPRTELELSFYRLLERLRVRAQEVLWRSEQDRMRRLTLALLEALDGVEKARNMGELRDEGRYLEHERFYAKANLFGYRLALNDAPLSQGLRSLGMRMLVARALGRWVEANHPDDADWVTDGRYPLAAIDMLMRHGLEPMGAA